MKNLLTEYINSLSAGTPTPGGGNAAAAAGAISCSLGMMVINLTLGKPKYAEVQEELKGVLEQLTVLQNQLLTLSEKDNAAFDEVMLAFKLAKATPEEQQKRKEAIAAATLNAAKVPAEVIKTAGEVIPLLTTVAEKGNKNSLSDTGVALQYLLPCINGALYNVMINCSSLSDNAEAAGLLSKCKTDSAAYLQSISLTIDTVSKKL